MSQVAANAWLVLLHNSRLGELHPHSTVRNAFGDRYVYSLCPSAPEAREYAIALCKDITDNYPVTGISLETPGFLPYAHGYHHEFAMVKPNRWLDNRLGLCFCDHCVESARQRASMRGGSKTTMREDIESYLAGDVDFPDDMAEAFWLSDVATDGALSSFPQLALRRRDLAGPRDSQRRCARTQRSRSSRRWRGRPGAPGTREAIFGALAEATGIIEACFYEPSVGARARRRSATSSAGSQGVGRLRGILRPGFPDLQSRASWSPPRRRFATPESQRSPSTTTVTCAAAILPGSPTRSPCSEVDRGVPDTKSSPSLARPAASVRSCAGISANEGAAIVALDSSEAVTGFRRAAPG